MQLVEFIKPVIHRGIERAIGDTPELPYRQAIKLRDTGFVTLGESEQSKPPVGRRLKRNK